MIPEAHVVYGCPGRLVVWEPALTGIEEARREAKYLAELWRCSVLVMKAVEQYDYIEDPRNGAGVVKAQEVPV